MKLSRRDLKFYLPLLKDIFTAADEKEALRSKEHLVLKLEEKYPKVAVRVDENLDSSLSQSCICRLNTDEQ